MQIPTKIFIHFFNPEILRAYGIKDTKKTSFLEKSITITKLAFIISDLPIIVPVSSIFENQYFKDFLEDVKPIISINFLKYISPTPDIAKYAEKKIREFYNQPHLYPVYSRKNFSKFIKLLEDIKWEPRIRNSASGEISSQWKEGIIQDTGLWRDIITEGDFKNADISKIESSIHSVPERLEGAAFVMFNAEKLLPFKINAKNATKVNLLINRAFIESYIYEYNSSILTDTPIALLDCGIIKRTTNFWPTISFRELYDVLRMLGLDFLIQSKTDWNSLIELKFDPFTEWFGKLLLAQYKSDNFKSFKKLILNVDFQDKRTAILKSRLSSKEKAKAVCAHIFTFFGQEQINALSTTVSLHRAARTLHGQLITKSSSDVFLIKGRDLEAAKVIIDFLASVGLNVIKWEEAIKLTGNTNPFVMEIIEAGFAKAGAAIALFTPDEAVELKRELSNNNDLETGYQSRPNVYIEAGMALGLFPDQTILVEIGESRTASDLNGLFTIRYDGSEKKKTDLINRLEMAGCRINKQ